MKYYIDEKDLNLIVSEVLFETDILKRDSIPLIDLYAEKYKGIIDTLEDIAKNKNFLGNRDDIDIDMEEFKKEALERLDHMWGHVVEDRLKHVLEKYNRVTE